MEDANSTDGLRPATPSTTRTEPLIFGKTTIHITHQLCYFRGVVFCLKCGSYSAGVAVHLKHGCSLHTLPGTANQLKRLRHGDTPHATFKWPSNITLLPRLPNVPQREPTDAADDADGGDDNAPTDPHAHLSPTMRRMLLRLRRDTPAVDAPPTSAPFTAPTAPRRHTLDDSQPDSQPLLLLPVPSTPDSDAHADTSQMPIVHPRWWI
jgi:hypothetical protein